MQIPARRWIAAVRQRIGDHVGNRNVDGESWIAYPTTAERRSLTGTSMGDYPLEVATRAAGYSIESPTTLADPYLAVHTTASYHRKTMCRGLIYLCGGDRKIRPRVGLCALPKRDARKSVLDVHRPIPRNVHEAILFHPLALAG
jgi:hypothetical protein